MVCFPTSFVPLVKQISTVKDLKYVVILFSKKFVVHLELACIILNLLRNQFQ